MTAAVVGTFDGVHLGHRFLLGELKRAAEARGLKPLAITFSEHPLSVICPERVPPALTAVAERKALIEAEGVAVEVLDFDERLRSMTSAEFLNMLHERYGVELFLLGFNNSIGSDRFTANMLAGNKSARTIGGVEIIAAGRHPAIDVSSSAVRAALANGDIHAVNTMLGRCYSLTGRVVYGRQLGRQLGFPTANIQPESGAALPKPGVYAGRMLGHLAVVNVGRRPTVEGCDSAPLNIEAHLLDFCGDLYGREVRLEFEARLRNERRFGSLEELTVAVHNDIDYVRKHYE